VSAPDPATIAATIAAGPFDATWESLRGFTIPEWYQDAKFGIFIHWGVYSLPKAGTE
jgi:alpha-L-fucosidase